MGTLASELGPHMDTVVGKPRVYVDANVPIGVVRFMRERLLWDVLYVMEHDEQRRAADFAHYQLARQLHRTLITMDRDFLDESLFPSSESGGVIVLQIPDERNLDKVLSRVDSVFFPQGRANSVPPLLGRKLKVHLDWHAPVGRSLRKRRRSPSYR